MRGTTRLASLALACAIAASLLATPGASGSAASTPLADLERAAGSPLVVRRTAEGAVRHLFAAASYLSGPTDAPPETVARAFVRHHRAVFGLTVGEVDALVVRSRATVPDIATTIVVLERRIHGVAVDKAWLVVNVNGAGRVMSVSGDAAPGSRIAGGWRLGEADAVAAIARHRGVRAVARALGVSRVMRAFGDLPAAFDSAKRFRADALSGRPIDVTRVVVPLGADRRAAYALTTEHPDHGMHRTLVDASDGRILADRPLTRSAGLGTGRGGSLRPDLQATLDGFRRDGAAGKVFAGSPTVLAGAGGFGRTRRGVSPRYGGEASTDPASGRGFKRSQAVARAGTPLVYGTPFGQVTRGLPDALHPTGASPLGWFYLPTGAGGARVDRPRAGYATTRDYGYTMAAEAVARNRDDNSPTRDGRQGFSATRRALPEARVLADGRRLDRVYESRYTEGNNALVADDREGDDSATQGVRGYASDRRFTRPSYTYTAGYEFGGSDAGGDEFFPRSSDGDVYPATVALFTYVNLVHDYLHDIGFTESLWNFQQDNLGRGGAGGDGVRADVHDGSGTDNATFGTPDDGEPPRMQMFLFTDGNLRRADTSLDLDIVAHELYHGVSNRSAGKGSASCLFGEEAGGQGEGWSDFVALSMTDDDGAGDPSTGELDSGIRRMPATNYPWSYGSLNGVALARREGGLPDVPGAIPFIPFEVHDIGEAFAAMLWDLRELLIVKHPGGAFFDGSRRLGNGKRVFVGERLLRSRDGGHPIDFRSAFGTIDGAVVGWEPRIGADDIRRPLQLRSEIARRGDHDGPLTRAVVAGGRLADTLVLRGLQIGPCDPTIVDTRDAILLADRELTGGENAPLIWRAFASHGVGADASSTVLPFGSHVQESFDVPAGVGACEGRGPLAAPRFTVRTDGSGVIELAIGRQTGAARFVVSRAIDDGRFSAIAELGSDRTTFRDPGLRAPRRYRYQVRASRTPDLTCVSAASTRSVRLADGRPVLPRIAFGGVTRAAGVDCGAVRVEWTAAYARGRADIVYDVHRVSELPAREGGPPRFPPSAENRIATGVRATSFTDAGPELNEIAYYAVVARDRRTGARVAGSDVVAAAPAAPRYASEAPFSKETFEGGVPAARMIPPVVLDGTGGGAPAFRLVATSRNGRRTTALFAPNLAEPSDFSSAIGPLALGPRSVLDFQHRYRTEAGYDGGVVEISFVPAFAGVLSPDGVTAFDLGDHMVQGGYPAGVQWSLIDGGRRGFTGSADWHRVRVPLADWAPGGRHNPLGAPAFIRFRMGSDSAFDAGPRSGWLIDDVLVGDLDETSCPRGRNGP